MVWSLLVLACAPLLAGREVLVDKVWIAEEEGEPFSVKQVVQGPRGFLWILTDVGLFRYDGYDYLKIKARRGGGGHLLSNDISVLFRDSRKRIWVGTSEGLSIISDPFEPFRNFEFQEGLDEGLLDNNVSAISEDSEGNVWVATRDGFNRYDEETFSFERFAVPNLGEKKDTLTESFVVDDENQIWFGNKIGLSRFNPRSQTIATLTPGALFGVDVAEISVKNLFLDQNRLWVLFEREVGSGADIAGQVVYDLEKEAFMYPEWGGENPPDFDRIAVTRMMRDADGRLWLGTRKNGAYLYDGKRRQWEHFGNVGGKSNQLFMGSVLCLYQDLGGIVWVGTQTGLNKILETQNNFFQIFVGNSEASEAPRDVQRLTVDAKGDLWAAVDDVLYRRKAGSREFERYTADDDDPTALREGTILKIVSDSQGVVYVLNKYELHRFEREKNQFERMLEGVGDPDIKSFLVQSIFVDKKNRLWMPGGGTDTDIRIVRFDPKYEKFKIFSTQNPDINLHPQNHYTGYCDREGRVWLGGDKGVLTRYIERKNKFVHFELTKEKVRERKELHVYSITSDPSGNLWLSTGYSLFRFNPDKEKFRLFDSTDSIPDREIYAVVADKTGYLWLTHGKGLTRYLPETREAVNYNMRDGVNNRFHWASYAHDARGMIYFGGTNGITMFHPKEIQASDYIPPITLTYVDSSEGKMSVRALQDGGTLRLAYGELFFKVGVAAMDFSQPRRNLYRFKLEPRDEEWSLPQTNNAISVKHLSPGFYKLHIEGSNSNGSWRRLEPPIHVEIVPPFWRSTPALIFYAVMIPCLWYGSNRWRYRHMARRSAELESMVEERTESLRREKRKTEEQARQLMEMDKLKTQFFSNISHEFRTPLTLILGPLESLLNAAGVPSRERLNQQHEIMLRNGRRLLRLINQLLDISRLEAGRMKMAARKLNITAFAKPILAAFDSLARTREIKLSIESTDPDLEVWFDAEKVEKILFNLLANAFQFTDNGGSISLSLSVTRDNLNRDAVQLCVTDTGCGIDEKQRVHIFDRFRQVDGSHTREREGTGIGLSLVKELVGLHHGQVWVESEIGKGSSFFVVLPLGKKHFKAKELCQEHSDPDQFAAPGQAQIEIAHLRDEQEKAGALRDRGLGETVLVVDDHPDIRDYIRNTMETDYRVIEAVDGRHGLEMARQHKPDLIISDVMMPVMDGYEMCRQIRRDRDLNHTPIIMLTAKASDEMKVEGLEIGANDYISKPFNARELCARVRNLLNIREQERNMKRSLEMAHKAQVCMLPAKVPSFEGLEIASFSQPAREVGGDYFDFVMRDGGRLGVVIGDVSGKGMPAALYMTMTKGLVQAYSADTDSPKEALSHINRQFHRASAANIFLSLQYAIFDPEKGSMLMANGGHNPPILYRREQQTTEFVKSRGMAIGLESGNVFDRVVEENTITVAPGDILVFYTDGIVEAMNEQHEVFGESRLADLVRANHEMTPNELLEVVRREYGGFVGHMDQFDDMTLVIVRIPPAQAGRTAA
ncbi:SpoIIE family protein phosphatase [Acanthopleuribacter pedis]|uniref:histidine kinase n=1 Tax=Acanthopleuribacter pedis TaxID=442870 RepID=A0A8J7QC95_9BACT|nr:SpoIIE family protein phosphatase [Acanthopleuribacter pedis]MBO1323041.1 SpoIIE family protein phosphatase [Acanthopleuribacter pedis]